MNRAALLALALLAAGCTEDADAPAEQARAAAGEVQGGTISDAMVPLEQLESQAPFAQRQEPAVIDIDAEQPVITPAPGIESLGTSEAAEAEALTPDPALAE